MFTQWGCFVCSCVRVFVSVYTVHMYAVCALSTFGPTAIFRN